MRKIVTLRKKRSKESTSKEILIFLATSEPKSKWQIMKELGKSYGNVHETIKILLQQGMVKIQDSQPSARNPKIEVESYGLTLHGLVVYLKSLKNWVILDAIADNCKDLLPLIFGKWRFLTDHGLKDTIIGNFREYLRNRPLNVDFSSARELFEALDFTPEQIEAKINAAKDAGQAIERAVEIIHEEARINAFVLLRPSPDLGTVLSVFKADEDLRSFADKMLRAKKQQIKNELKTASDWLRYWDGLKVAGENHNTQNS
jgi:biotin operon repressor